jgi:hypothetical protein
MSNASRTIAVTLSLAFATTLRLTAADDTVSRMRVYDGVGLAAQTREAAIATAKEVTTSAGIDVAWQDCTRRLKTSRCDPSRGAHELIVRILNSSSNSSPRGAGRALSAAGVANEHQRTTLGVAIVDRDTGKGEMATIYMDQVMAVARRTGVAPAVILGRAMAHEAGHLLLARGHDRTGVMREVWTDEEVIANRTEDWVIESLSESAGR